MSAARTDVSQVSGCRWRKSLQDVKQLIDGKHLIVRDVNRLARAYFLQLLVEKKFVRMNMDGVLATFKRIFHRQLANETYHGEGFEIV